MGIQQVLLMQSIGGGAFALLSAQPMAVVMMTAPFVLFTRMLFGAAQSLQVPFLAFYGWTGIWCSVYCLLIGVFNLSWMVSEFRRDSLSTHSLRSISLLRFAT